MVDVKLSLMFMIYLFPWLPGIFLMSLLIGVFLSPVLRSMVSFLRASFHLLLLMIDMATSLEKNNNNIHPFTNDHILALKANTFYKKK